MARFAGKIGFLTTVEKDPVNRPSVYSEVITYRQYYGDVFQHSRHWNQNGNLNEDLAINNRISVVTDKFIRENLGAMRCVKWLGDTWKITNAEIQYPRVILTIGGQYHEPESD